MSTADNLPNFDSMSPEEIMAWMESLAKRQGATEGFTTAADMQVEEIDPDTVVIDEPGYVPYGQDPAKWREQEAARKASQTSVQPPKPVTQSPKPSIPPVQPTQPPAISRPPTTPPQPTARPVAASAPPPVPSASPRPVEQPKRPEPEPVSGLSWLESLAADQSTDFPDLDLSGLAAEIAPVAPSSPQPVSNPIDWLESLTRTQEEPPSAVPAAEPPVQAKEPFAESVDPVTWLESLAKRQGVRSEELVTEADLDVPLPEEAAADGPGYTDYLFETPGQASPRPQEEPVLAESLFEPETQVDLSSVEDPAAWLDSLASSQGFAPDALRTVESRSEAKPPVAETSSGLDDDSIQSALARGEEIPHEQMQAWMNRQLEIGAQRPEPEPEYDPDAPAVPAELPDWLLEQVGKAPPEEVKPPVVQVQQPALIEEIFEPPAVADLPDWLKEDVEPQADLDDIFASVEVEPPAEQPVAETPSVPEQKLETEPILDANDPWGEALEYESQQDINVLPDWYVKNVNDPSRKAFVERQARGEAVPELSDADLEPEPELAAGQPAAVPDWLSAVITEPENEPLIEELPDWVTQDVVVEEVPPVVEEVAEPIIETGDMPDWLKSVDVETVEVPDWLKETFGTDEAAPAEPVVTPVPVEPVVTPAPVIVTTIQPPAKPVPVPQVAQLDVQTTLNQARARVSGNELEDGLRDYEALIRANAELPIVVDDLVKLAEKHKSNPGVFRVLGDGLMRQGKLQAALDTYRKALNQL